MAKACVAVPRRASRSWQRGRCTARFRTRLVRGQQMRCAWLRPKTLQRAGEFRSADSENAASEGAARGVCEAKGRAAQGCRGRRTYAHGHGKEAELRSGGGWCAMVGAHGGCVRQRELVSHGRMRQAQRGEGKGRWCQRKGDGMCSSTAAGEGEGKDVIHSSQRSGNVSSDRSGQSSSQRYVTTNQRQDQSKEHPGQHDDLTPTGELAATQSHAA